ncbi:MAG: WG repeat-containing protein [Taibaiella sp.]|nr:WG repeat-containing protein [Taibaiella sp.]
MTILNLRYYLSLLLLLCLANSSYGQADSALLRLQRRYGPIFHWGQCYVVNSQGWYAFAGANGKLKTSFIYEQIDTVLPDRAIAWLDSARTLGTLFDNNGEMVCSGSQGIVRLVDLERRVFAGSTGIGKEMLFDDSCCQINCQEYDVGASLDGMLLTMQYRNETLYYGVITARGATVLPNDYRTASYGAELYSGVRGDTAFVFQRGRGLLFALPGVHDCRVLANDAITVKKYGAWALISRSGKLLTGFRYPKIEECRAPYSVVARDSRGSQKLPPLIPQFLRVGMGQPEGIIDTNGVEVFPPVYDDLFVNENGWVIARKVMHDEAQLLDSNHIPVLSAGSYEMKFRDRRYLTIETRSLYSDDIRERTYDMKLRKYVQESTRQLRSSPFPAPSSPQPVIRRVGENSYTNIISHHYNGDSMIINLAGTKLIRSGGYWGVCAVTGDTVLPFIYDTAGKYGYEQFFVGKDCLFAAIDKEGDLATPCGLPSPPWQVRTDSLVFMTDRSAYRFNGWKLHKVDMASEPVYEYMSQFDNFGLVFLATDQFKPGFYDRQLRQVAQWPLNPSDKNYGVVPPGVAAIADSEGRCMAVIDSSGRLLVPWMQKPRRFLLFRECGLALSEPGKPDLLFRFTGATAMVDTIWVNPEEKSAFLRQGGRLSDLPTVGHRQVLKFSIPGQVNGFVTGEGNCVMLKEAEQLQLLRYHILVKTNGHWGIRTWRNEVLLPSNYDTIVATDYRYLTYRHGKVGVFDPKGNRLYPTVFDSIRFTGSLDEQFLMGRIADEIVFMDANGHIFSGGWSGIPLLWYKSICGITAQRNGVQYRLFPTLGDSLEAVPYHDLPEGVSVVSAYMDGSAIVRKGGLYGVYSISKKVWLVPLRFSVLYKRDNYFIGETAPKNSTSIYTSEGNLLFSKRGLWDPQREDIFKHWYLAGHAKPPVVNDAGRTVVPDTFTNCWVVGKPRLAWYLVRARNGLNGIVDTSGRIIVPAVYDWVDAEPSLFDRYFTASIDHRVSLLNRKGKILTRRHYWAIHHGYRERPPRRVLGSYYQEDEPDVDDMLPYFVVSLGMDSAFGVIDSMGNTLLACVYDNIAQVHHGTIAVVKKGGKWGIVNIRSKTLIAACKYDRIGIFYDGTAFFRRGDITGTINEEGEEQETGAKEFDEE